MEPLSRPLSLSSSGSNPHSNTSFPQLPGLAALTSLSTRTSNSPHPRQPLTYTTTNVRLPVPSPLATSGGNPCNSLPICMNCRTSTTPLWRRDELGSVLCNACGLFLKLHGRSRPISLKTDVIKSRNRVKGSSSGITTKKKTPFDTNGLEQVRSQIEIAGHRRSSQKSTNDYSDGSNSPISRHSTPSMFVGHLSAFKGNSLDDPYGHNSSSNTHLHLRQTSPGRSISPMITANGLEIPQTYEQLIAQNASLKTRVSELEVINELFRGRVAQLEQDEGNARRGEEMRKETNNDLTRRLEESQRRENQLKHRLDDVERELCELKEGAPPLKKIRVADMVAENGTPAPIPIKNEPLR